jgi:hypothetical protein
MPSHRHRDARPSLLLFATRSQGSETQEFCYGGFDALPVCRVLGARDIVT